MVLTLSLFSRPQGSSSTWLLLLILAGLVVLCTYIAAVCILVNRSEDDTASVKNVIEDEDSTEITQTSASVTSHI